MLFQMHSWAVEKSLQIHTILVTITYCIYNISIDRCISSMYINSLGLRTCHSSLHRHSSCLERRGNIRTRLPLSLWLLADACHCQCHQPVALMHLGTYIFEFFRMIWYTSLNWCSVYFKAPFFLNVSPPALSLVWIWRFICGFWFACTCRRCLGKFPSAQQFWCLRTPLTSRSKISHPKNPNLYAPLKSNNELKESSSEESNINMKPPKSSTKFPTQNPTAISPRIHL